MDWNRTALHLLQTVMQILLDFLQWKQEIAVLKAANRDVKAYFPVFSRFYPGDLVLMNYYFDGIAGDIEAVAAHVGDLDDPENAEQAIDLMFSAEFQENSFRREFYDISSPKLMVQCLCHNIYWEEEYLGYLVMLDRNSGNLLPGELSLLQLIVEVLEPVVYAQSDRTHVLSRDVQLHELLRDAVLGEIPETDAGQELDRILTTSGWSRQDRCCAVDLCFFEGISTAASGNYLCRRLENQWPHSFAVIAGDHIYWILNGTKHKIMESDESFQKMILGIVSTYICRAGVSHFFQGFGGSHGIYPSGPDRPGAGDEKGPAPLVSSVCQLRAGVYDESGRPGVFCGADRPPGAAAAGRIRPFPQYRLCPFPADLSSGGKECIPGSGGAVSPQDLSGPAAGADGTDHGLCPGRRLRAGSLPATVDAPPGKGTDHP